MRDDSGFVVIIFALVLIIGLMAYNNNYHRPVTVGEKIDDAIERTGDAVHDLGHDLKRDFDVDRHR